MSAVCAAMQASFFVTYKRALLRAKNNQIVKFVIAVLFYVGNLSHSHTFYHCTKFLRKRANSVAMLK